MRNNAKFNTDGVAVMRFRRDVPIMAVTSPGRSMTFVLADGSIQTGGFGGGVGYRSCGTTMTIEQVQTLRALGFYAYAIVGRGDVDDLPDDAPAFGGGDAGGVPDA